MPASTLSLTPRCPRYEALELWRGVACLMVVVLHSVLFTTTYAYVCNDLPVPEAQGWAGRVASVVVTACARGWWGVPIFFVISGYCITATVDSVRRKSVPVRTYFFRRVRRIFPPYWAAVALAAAAVWVVDRYAGPGLFAPSPSSLSRMQWLGTLLLTERWRGHFTTGPTDFLLRQAWTLGYEEQFYLVSGIILLLARRHLFVASVVLTVMVSVVAGLAGPLGYNVDGFFFDGYWFLFAAGILVYYALNYCPPARVWVAQVVLLVGIVFYARHWHDMLGGKTNIFNQSVAVGLAFALGLIVLRPFDGAWVGSRWARPFMWCGRMCYSLYLIHWPVTRVITTAFSRAGHKSDLFMLTLAMPLCLVGSLGCSWLFYLTVERRFLNHRPTRRSTTDEPVGEGIDRVSERVVPSTEPEFAVEGAA